MTTHTRAPHHGRRLRAVVAAFLAALLTAVAVACAPAEDPIEPSADIPDTPVGAHAAWVLEQLNGEEIADESAVEERFDPALWETVPLSDLRTKLEELRTQQPWTVASYDGTEAEATVRIDSSHTQFDMNVSVGEDDRMNGLFFAAPQPERTPAADWDELRENLEAAPFEASLQVFEMGADTPSVAIGDTQAAPVGSVVKLYVLGALVDAVAAGRWPGSRR
ncbi:Cpe/LpqF family protein [Pseudactinotalea suaedae]|uniref:Cpe/LpqF family protein n=1 Tax=Pseudactinotalea suaedae TaxID=1524924 RepID=UPI0012E1D92A|nr:Cpe/LpqF family protein [Pseudactinotalea suaedae]